VTVLGVFGFSLLLRILYDLLWMQSVVEGGSYHDLLFDLLTAIPFDLIPFMLILCLHRRNLKAYKQESDLDYGLVTSQRQSPSALDESYKSTVTTEKRKRNTYSALDFENSAQNDLNSLVLVYKKRISNIETKRYVRHSIDHSFENCSE